MKVKPSLYNIVITTTCIVLSVLLYRVYHVQSFSPAFATAPAATAMPSPLMQTPDPWALKDSFYQPFGELPLPVLQQYAQYDTDRHQDTLQAKNPIDIAFAPYWKTSKGTMEENALATDYRECWEAEALHALDLLTMQANPAAERVPQMSQEVKNRLLDFSDITGELYADIFRTDVFLYEGGHPERTISIGSAYPGALTIAKASFLRSYTFYLYDLLDWMDVQPDFVFQAKDVQDEWGYLLEK